jgi:hypothetical protein
VRHAPDSVCDIVRINCAACSGLCNGITATDLSTFTAFFNPHKDTSGAWTQKDRDRYDKGYGSTWEYSKGYVDSYWDADAFYHNGNIVYKWWDNCETFNYTIAFSVAIPVEKISCPLTDNKDVTKILSFGY